MKNWGTIIRLYGKYKLHVSGLVVLGVVGAIFDGLAINIAVPSLSFLINPNFVPSDIISKTVANLFAVVGISFTFRHLIFLITGLMFARAGVLIVFGYLRGWITGDFLASESKTVLRLVMNASWPFLLKQKIGYVQNTIERDLQRSVNLLESFSQFVQSCTGFLMYLLVALNISPQITLFTSLAGLSMLFIVRPLLKRTNNIGNYMANTDRRVSQFVTEHIIGMKAVKAAGVERKVYAAGAELFNTLHSLYVRLSTVRSLSTSFFQPFAMVYIIILFTLTYHSGSFDIVSFAATLYLIQKIFTYLESTQAALQGTRELIPYAVHVDEFKQELLIAQETPHTELEMLEIQSPITFEDVSFEYSEEKKVLDSISFTIPPGKTTAIIGPSGAGKTSVADLLLRLFTPTRGKIMINEINYQDFSLESLRSVLGYVAQDPFLLHASIVENVRFYRNEITDTEILNALQAANLTEFIDSLPEGKETVVGDRGVMLSGGQRQRISLARALAGSPQMLILDEATSALDRESEALIQKSIEALHGKITVVVIAHRLQTIQNADKIIVLEKGRVIEEGSPKELLSNPNSYYTKHST